MKKPLLKLRFHRTEIFIFAFFTFLSLIVTYPLIFKMRSYLYGPGGDPLGTVHGFWWLKYAYLHHVSPRFIPIIASPFGADYSHILQLVVINFMGKWLSILVNEIFAYNFIILLTFLLSSVTMYLLVHYFTKNKLASLFSGIVYAFCPYHLVHASQHIALANIQWMPLYIFALSKLDEERRYEWAILCGGLFALNTFSDYQYGYFILVLTAAFIAWQIWQGFRGRGLTSYPVNKLTSRPRKIPSGSQGKQVNKGTRFHSFKVILVAVVVAAAIILPPAYYSFRNIFATPERYVRPMRDLFSNSARLLGYLLPSQDNPFFGEFTKKFIKNPLYGGHPTEHTLYLGWVGIVLSIVAVREWRRKSKLANKLTSKQVNKLTSKQVNKLTRKQVDPLLVTRCQRGVSFFLFAAIVALIFSHSPWTDIGPFRILFPSYFMYKVLPMFRVYARFGIVVMLCVSVLAGIGLASILEKIRSMKKRRIFLSIVFVLVFIEFAPTLPAPMVNAVHPPPVYEWLSKEKGDFTIVEYPIETDYEYLFWQRIHQKRLVNGTLSGTYADKVGKEIVDILKPETPGILKYLGAKYVILHPDKYLKSEDVPVIGEVPDVSKQKGLRLIKTFEPARQRPEPQAMAGRETRVYKIVAEPTKPTIED